MIKTPLSTVIGGAFWTPGATVIGGQQSFSQLIKKLFANGEQGFFYDPNDLSAMYQDAAGTVPVTAVGQAVGLIRDKSGRNNHAFQSNSASRPILRQNAVTGANYLEFDGSDDFLQTSNIDFTGTDKVSLFTGVRKLSDATKSAVIELSVNSQSVTNAGSFSLLAPTANGLSNIGGTLNGSAARSFFVSGLPAPFNAVTTNYFDVSKANITDSNKFRINGSIQTYAGESPWSPRSSFDNHPLYIGRRGGSALPFNGHIYSLIGIGKLTTDNETAGIEKELAKRLGVTLNV